MNSLPAVTLVTPSFNQADSLERTICSVLDQGYENLKYFVYDGGSTDQSAQIIRRYAGKLTGWRSASDGGQSSAINQAWEEGPESDLFGWINSDDYLLPGALLSVAQEYVACQDRGESVGVIAGSGIKIDKYGRTLKVVDVNNVSTCCPKTVMQFLQPSTYFSSLALSDVGVLREELVYGMDWELLLRINKRYSIRYLDKMLSALQVASGTKTSCGGWERLREIAAIGKLHNGLLDRNNILFHLYVNLVSVKDEEVGLVGTQRNRTARLLQTILNNLIDPSSHMIHW